MGKLLAGVIVLLLGLVALPPILSPLLGWGPDESAAPPPGRLVEVAGGHRINVLEAGSGPPVLLVHGTPGSAYDWRPLPERLARNHRVIRYDRIGYGHSDRRAKGEEFTLDANARDLVALLDALELRDATLVGWSFGGGTVQRAALLAPNRARRLVLIGSIGPSFDSGSPGRIERILFSEPILQWGMAAGFPARAVASRLSAASFGSAEAVPAWWLEQSLGLISLPGTIHSWVEENRNVQVGGLKVEDLRLPVLIIQGTGDRNVPASVAEDLHRKIPRSELLVVPDGSHMLPITHPDLLATRIATFTRSDAG
jgi:pimeloyl-ACP methyl ester carboxylesterase